MLCLTPHLQYPNAGNYYQMFVDVEVCSDQGTCLILEHDPCLISHIISNSKFKIPRTLQPKTYQVLQTYSPIRALATIDLLWFAVCTDCPNAWQTSSICLTPQLIHVDGSGLSASEALESPGS
ncbi:unnamed protein product [Choristocarpus tenellus]